MPLRHKRIKQPKKINYFDCFVFPVEIWVNILRFGTETDRRKISVTCSTFAQIYDTFFWMHTNQTMMGREFDFKYIRFGPTLMMPFFFTRSEYRGFELISTCFKVTGPTPHLIAKVTNYDAEIIINLNHEDPNTLFNINSFNPPFSIKIIKAVDCLFKFTNALEKFFYVEGSAPIIIIPLKKHYNFNQRNHVMGKRIDTNPPKKTTCTNPVKQQITPALCQSHPHSPNQQPINQVAKHTKRYR